MGNMQEPDAGIFSPRHWGFPFRVEIYLVSCTKSIPTDENRPGSLDEVASVKWRVRTFLRTHVFEGDGRLHRLQPDGAVQKAGTGRRKWLNWDQFEVEQDVIVHSMFPTSLEPKHVLHCMSENHSSVIIEDQEGVRVVPQVSCIAGFKF